MGNTVLNDKGDHFSSNDYAVTVSSLDTEVSPVVIVVAPASPAVTVGLTTGNICHH